MLPKAQTEIKRVHSAFAALSAENTQLRRGTHTPAATLHPPIRLPIRRPQLRCFACRRCAPAASFSAASSKPRRRAATELRRPPVCAAHVGRKKLLTTVRVRDQGPGGAATAEHASGDEAGKRWWWADRMVRRTALAVPRLRC